jgi:hypothetical protein
MADCSAGAAAASEATEMSAAIVAFAPLLGGAPACPQALSTKTKLHPKPRHDFINSLPN